MAYAIVGERVAQSASGPTVSPYRATGNSSVDEPVNKARQGACELRARAIDDRYARARARLLSLRRPDRQAIDYAWHWLLTWRRLVAPQGLDLPVPRIFSNEDGVVQLEWEVGGRFLQLELTPNAFEYTQVDERAGFEQDGKVGVADVPVFLLWVAGK